MGQYAVYRNKGEEVKMTSKAPRVFFSLLIGTILLVVLALFLEITPNNIPKYVRQVANTLNGGGTFEDRHALLIARIVIGILAVMTVSTAYMLPLRATRAVRKTISLGDRFTILLHGYYLIGFTGMLAGYFVPNGMIDMIIKTYANAQGKEYLTTTIAVLLWLILFMVVIGLIIWALQVFVVLFRDNIKVNGVWLGILSAIYDTFSSVFIAAIIIGGICFGIGMFIGLIAFLGAAFSGGKHVVEIDGKYYYVDLE